METSPLLYLLELYAEQEGLTIQEVTIKEKKMETHSSIDISTLKAINAMVYELGWYKNEPCK